ncbi:MAG: hypothetical protein ACTSR8_01560 [Promethearchaeota archaeon]
MTTTNYTREELLDAEATMNQMRNAINHLVRFMDKNKVKNKKERLRRMGKNMGATYARYWKPTEVITENNIRDVIATIYQTIFNSNVSVEIDANQKLILVKDYKCALCKYQYNDIDVAGCEIIIAMVAELVSKTSAKSEKESLFLDPLDVKESKALGHRLCMQIYKYRSGGE